MHHNRGGKKTTSDHHLFTAFQMSPMSAHICSWEMGPESAPYKWRPLLATSLKDVKETKLLCSCAPVSAGRGHQWQVIQSIGNMCFVYVWAYWNPIPKINFNHNNVRRCVDSSGMSSFTLQTTSLQPRQVHLDN